MREMPWEESRVLDQRVKFIAELLKGEESMTTLCHVFGISRKTGYKWRDRYRSGGPVALSDMSRRPKVNPRATSKDVVDQILALRAKHPTWGARKLRVRMQRLHPQLAWPAPSTAARHYKRGIKQNTCDNAEFFAKYNGMPRSAGGLRHAEEWPFFRDFAPNLRNRPLQQMRHFNERAGIDP